MAYRGVLAIIVGAALLCWPRRLAGRAIAKHDSRLTELEAGAEEAYFEEKRSLQSYRPPQRELTWRIGGAFLLVLGIVMLAFDTH